MRTIRRSCAAWCTATWLPHDRRCRARIRPRWRTSTICVKTCPSSVTKWETFWASAPLNTPCSTPEAKPWPFSKCSACSANVFFCFLGRWHKSPGTLLELYYTLYIIRQSLQNHKSYVIFLHPTCFLKVFYKSFQINNIYYEEMFYM